MSVDEHADTPPVMRQQQLVQQIGRVLLGSVDAPWDILRYETSSLIGYQEDLLRIQTGDANTQKSPPHELLDLTEELREVMYQRGAGTWYSAVITVSRPQSLAAEFNYDDEPPWDVSPADEAYAQDLEKFPRDDAAIPDWLRQRLAT